MYILYIYTHYFTVCVITPQDFANLIYVNVNVYVKRLLQFS